MCRIIFIQPCMQNVQNTTSIVTCFLCHHLNTRNGKQQQQCESMMQGFGNVGAWAAEMLHVRGGRVLCVSDRDGAIHNEQGLDIHALRRHLAATPPFGDSLLSFPGGPCIWLLCWLHCIFRYLCCSILAPLPDIQLVLERLLIVIVAVLWSSLLIDNQKCNCCNA